MNNNTSGTLAIAAILLCMSAWFTHIIHCLLHAKYLLLLAGGLMFPIGIIHGIGIWFGMSW